jgi:UPF0716 protein FxsA
MQILLFLVFIAVPIIELAVILQVGDLIGLWPTLALLIVVSVLGTWLVRREGMRAWNALRLTLAHGRVPTNEVIDGALVLFGGALLLTPGFVTDVLGLFLVFPATRAVARRAVRVQARRRLARRGRRVDVEVVDVRPSDSRRVR